MRDGRIIGDKIDRSFPACVVNRERAKVVAQIIGIETEY